MSEPSATEKRDQTLEAQCLAFILNHDGRSGTEIPSHLRRFLRPLEKRNMIVWHAGGWHIRKDLTNE